MKISIVIPAYNESESLPQLFAELHAALDDRHPDWEAIVVDDGSTDSTFATVREAAGKDAHLRGVRLRRNSGKAFALAAGFAEVTGEIVVTMDADLQDDPMEVVEMTRMIVEDGWDLVSGWKQKRNDPLEKRLPSKVYNAVVSKVSGIRLHDFNCGLKAYRREVLPHLKLYGQMHRFFPVMAHWEGFRVTEKVVHHRARSFGVSKYGFRRYFHGFFDLLSLTFLNRYLRQPLHLFGLWGLLCMAIGALPILWFLGQWVVTGNLRIRPLLLFATGAEIMGLQFISMGLVAELIQSRDRQLEVPVAEKV
jgi:dolichol-phosphate mannosyltransferase